MFYLSTYQVDKVIPKAKAKAKTGSKKDKQTKDIQADKIKDAAAAAATKHLYT